LKVALSLTLTMRLTKNSPATFNLLLVSTWIAWILIKQLKLLKLVFPARNGAAFLNKI